MALDRPPHVPCQLGGVELVQQAVQIGTLSAPAAHEQRRRYRFFQGVPQSREHGVDVAFVHTEGICKFIGAEALPETHVQEGILFGIEGCCRSPDQLHQLSVQDDCLRIRQLTGIDLGVVDGAALLALPRGQRDESFPMAKLIDRAIAGRGVQPGFEVRRTIPLVQVLPSLGKGYMDDISRRIRAAQDSDGEVVNATEVALVEQGESVPVAAACPVRQLLVRFLLELAYGLHR